MSIRLNLSDPYILCVPLRSRCNCNPESFCGKMVEPGEHAIYLKGQGLVSLTHAWFVDCDSNVRTLSEFDPKGYTSFRYQHTSFELATEHGREGTIPVIHLGSREPDGFAVDSTYVLHFGTQPPTLD